MAVTATVKLAIGSGEETVTIEIKTRAGGDNPLYHASQVREVLLEAAQRADTLVVGAYGDVPKRQRNTGWYEPLQSGCDDIDHGPTPAAELTTAVSGPLPGPKSATRAPFGQRGAPAADPDTQGAVDTAKEG